MTEGTAVATISALALVFGALAGVVSTLITTRVQAKRHGDDVRLTRIRDLEGRVESLEAKDRVHQDYIYRLRDHIAKGSPPPPPPWPSYA